MTDKQRFERFQKLKLCDDMEQELLTILKKSSSLKMKLAKQKDLKDIRNMRKQLKKQRFENG